MRRLLITCCLAALLVGCDATSGFNQVRKSFPDSEVQQVPGCPYYYLVRDTNGAVWYVKSDGQFQSPNFTNLIFSAQK